MKKSQMLVFGISLIVLSACGEAKTSGINETYLCKHSDGRFGARLKFESGGKLVLDFLSDKELERSPDLADRNNVPGTYTIEENIVTITYFQEHRLIKSGDTMQHEVKSLEHDIFDNCAKVE